MVMPLPVVRRAADPQTVQWLWTAITAIRSHKQIANEERIVRHIRREHGNLAAESVTSQLRRAVSDGLIIEYRTLVQKGSAVGTEQDAYRVPEDDIVYDDHDWYCFECHHPGEVLECSTCWRVFHCECIRTPTTVDFVCDICKQTGQRSEIKRNELNRLLSFTILRLKEKSTGLHWFGGAELGLDRFVHRYLDLNIMQDRTNNGFYTTVAQFYADTCTIRHNICVCFGDVGVLQQMAAVMLRDCSYDLNEIRQCKDCYLHSNVKNKDWFCQPCRSTHELVFAKQKGFGFWPAKVVKVTDAGYDVRFFGARHQRALVAATNIRAVDTNPNTLGIKRTSGFVKACNELARHQELVKRAAQVGFEKSSDNEEKDEEVAVRDNGNHNADKSTSETDIDSPPSIRRRRLPHKTKRVEHNGFRNTATKLNSNLRQNAEDSSVVSSSEDRNRVTKLTMSCNDAGVQTIKVFSLADVNVTHQETQTENDSFSTCTADCEARFEVKLRDFRARVDRELNEKMQDALRTLEEQLRKEFEEDEQRAMQRNVSANARSTEVVRLQAEKDSREQFEEEMKLVLQKHSADISATKKKQWCFNCESEAMYHCCWNTSYCSIKCQQEHWHHEHKRVCRRKRP